MKRIIRSIALIALITLISACDDRRSNETPIPSTVTCIREDGTKYPATNRTCP